MRSRHFILILSLIAVIGSLTGCRKAVWTKKETIDWYTNYSSIVHDGLRYQGSDAQSHHFIARVMDEWVFIRVRKSQLKLDDERPFSTGSNAHFTYYAVDPSQNFKKIEQKSPGEPAGAANSASPHR
jgi:hypothetical protein